MATILATESLMQVEDWYLWIGFEQKKLLEAERIILKSPSNVSLKNINGIPEED